MTLKQGFAHLLKSEAYQQKERTVGKYRTYRLRYCTKKLGEQTMIDLLQEFNYKVTKTIEVNPPK